MRTYSSLFLLGALIDRAQRPACVSGGDALRQGVEGIEHGVARYGN